MRLLGLTLSALLACGPALVAQDAKAPPRKDPPPAAAPLNPKNQKFLDAYLKAWSERMDGINGLETRIVLTEVEAGPPPAKRVYTGEASLMKPNYAKMFLKEQNDPTNAKRWRHFVGDGQYLWDYQYSTKRAHVLQLPKEGGGDNTMLAFLFGMKVDDIKKRYDLSIDVDDDKKHNEHYLHIGIRPKLKADMQEFEKAELVLWKSRAEKWADVWMLPARLWFQHPNGNQITWQFQQMTTKKQFAKDHFKAPGFPDKDWKSEWIKPPTPTVSRTAGPK